MNKRLLLLGAAAIGVFGCGQSEEPRTVVARHVSYRRTRVAVADGQIGKISIFDAQDEEFGEPILTALPVLPVSTRSGTFAFLPGLEGSKFLASGVSVMPHLDHIHIYKRPAQVLTPHFGTTMPVALASNAGWLVAMEAAAQSTQVLVMNERSLLRMESPSIAMVKVPTSDSQSGGALLPLGEILVVVWPGGKSVAYELGEMAPTPLAVELPDCVAFPSGPTQSVLSAVAGAHGAVACEDGLLTVVANGLQIVRAQKTAWPPGAGVPRSVLTQITNARFVVDLSASSFAVVDSTDLSTSARLVAKPGSDCGFTLDPSTGSSLVAMQLDGRIGQYALDGRAAAVSVNSVVKPGICANWMVAVAPQRAYVVDRRDATFVDIDLRSMTVAARYSVGGDPVGLDLLGLDEANININQGFD